MMAEMIDEEERITCILAELEEGDGSKEKDKIDEFFYCDDTDYCPDENKMTHLKK